MVAQRSGISVGLNHGHATTQLKVKSRVATRKSAYIESFTFNKKTRFVKDLIREVSGFAPYEKRILELLKNSKDKRARKLAKKRLGTFTRAKAKVDELSNVIAESRRHH
ncbi:60S ribosomal protein L36 [Smittium culicis]|uniref:60S ribosomal protein L36 n=1 Tax=Smittium culicis TaxID=133412 RepID=A0A1R1Y8D3_9FUNG|nr:60S ribosomal protein L36 [Smittium culicis]OMJ22966.1 60S ribosomal protein L36 [Smittium culicis]